jgi:NAD(P)-dependent dehydrogenase (short-subunit alcohol dehydrogenase family)
MELRTGQIAVVTGAAGGIGLALAHRFAAAGLDVVLADVDEAAAALAAEQVATTAGVQTLAVRCDVSDEASVAELAQSSLDRFGTVHVVCNNAGVQSMADAWSSPISTWEWVLGVNLWGVIHGIRAFLPILAAQGEGHIVNTASIAGILPGFGASYDASKHAVVALTEDLYRDVQMNTSSTPNATGPARATRPPPRPAPTST